MEQQHSRVDDNRELMAENLDVWRAEIQDRLTRYKTRRGRRIEGAFTMRFPFPPDPPSLADSAGPDEIGVECSEVLTTNIAAPIVTPDSVTTDDPSTLFAPASEPARELEQHGLEQIETLPEAAICESREFALAVQPVIDEPSPPPVARPRPRRKVIAFPKPVAMSVEDAHRLADPVFTEQPRILDVPEELEAMPATPFLEGLLDPLPNRSQPTGAVRDHLELAARPASLARRVRASLVDLAIVVGGASVFAATSYKLLPQIVLTKSLVYGSIAVFALLWAVYQYVFLVYRGTTPGMMVAKIRLCSFKGSPLGIRRRRSRVFGLYLSALALAMGLLWSLVDVDSLCWHDRISQSYPTSL